MFRQWEDSEKYSIAVSQMSKLFIRTICATLNFLQVGISFFSNTVRPINMKLGFSILFSIIIVYKNVLDDERIRKNIALQYLKCQCQMLLEKLCNNEFFCKLALHFCPILERTYIYHSLL